MTTTPYTLKKLTEVEDSRPEFGSARCSEARFAREDLDAEDTGVSLPPPQGRASGSRSRTSTTRPRRSTW